MANWHTGDLTAATNAPGAVKSSALISYSWPSESTQGVFYISGDGHIHDISWDKNSSWVVEDPTALANAPAASTISAITSYIWDDDKTQHVFYCSSDCHIRELVWSDNDTGWSSGDLTAATGAPSAVAGSALSSYVWPEQRTQHVFYFTGDGHVHSLTWDARQGAWSTQDLTAVTGAPVAAHGSDIASHVWSERQTQHVFYTTNNGHIQEITWDPQKGWQTGDVTATTGAPAAVKGCLVSYVWASEKTQGVFYFSGNCHVHDISWDKHDSWDDEDATKAAGAPDAISGSQLATYVWESEKKQHVFYCTPDCHVHEITWDEDDEWQDIGDITALATGGAPDAVRGTNLAGHIGPDLQTQHVFYLSGDGHVRELFWS